MAKTSRPKFQVRWVILIVLLLFIQFFQLPYYYSQPGGANVLDEVIKVEGGFEDEGSFMLTTVQMGRANPFFYIWAQLDPYRMLYPLDQIRFEGETDEEYNHRQLMAMSASQETAKVVAYEKAGKEVEFTYNGVLVTTLIGGMPADGVLMSGDRIIEVEGKSVQTAEQLIERLAGRTEHETVSLTIKRDGQTSSVEVGFSSFPEELGAPKNQVGIGISGPITDRVATFDPLVTIDSSQIGGPSAGLMFSLEIYNQLVENDLTKGHAIAGTGTIDDQGNVGRIGGAGQKVIAAHKAGAQYFLAPNEGGAEGSNYEEALEAAEHIDTKIQVIPVDTFDEAIAFLDSLPNK